MNHHKIRDVAYTKMELHEVHDEDAVDYRPDELLVSACLRT